MELALPEKVIEYRVTPRNVAKYKELILTYATPQMATAFFGEIYRGIQQGDVEALKLAGTVMGYTKKEGIQINNNINNSNTSITASLGKTFDSIARDLAEQKKNRTTFEAVATPTLMEEGD